MAISEVDWDTQWSRDAEKELRGDALEKQNKQLRDRIKELEAELYRMRQKNILVEATLQHIEECLNRKGPSR